MRPGRVVRVILGLIVLAIFGWWFTRMYTVTPKSDEVGIPGWTIATPYFKDDPSIIWMHQYKKYLAQQEAQTGETQTAAPVHSGEQQETATAEYAPEPTPEPTPTPDPVLEAATAKAASLGLPAPPAIDLSEWQYVLVNGDHPMDPIDYEPAELVYLNMTGDDTEIRTGYDGNRQVVDGRIAQPLIDMTQACKAAGLPVFLSSGYRSYSVQRENFNRVCANNGITDGKNGEGNYITMPAGCSEHQTGLCCDITDYYHEIKNDAIAQTATVQWLAEHCADYGFVLRFPYDKTNITHVMGESWHFRYVGVEAAKYMTENNLCLEEFLELYGVA